MINRNTSQIKTYQIQNESFQEDMHQIHATYFLNFIKMHVANLHFCKWSINPISYYFVLPSIWQDPAGLGFFFQHNNLKPKFLQLDKQRQKHGGFCQGRKLRILN